MSEVAIQSKIVFRNTLEIAITFTPLKLNYY